MLHCSCDGSIKPNRPIKPNYLLNSKLMFHLSVCEGLTTHSVPDINGVSQNVLIFHICLEEGPLNNLPVWATFHGFPAIFSFMDLECEMFHGEQIPQIRVPQVLSRLSSWSQEDSQRDKSLLASLSVRSNHNFSFRTLSSLYYTKITLNIIYLQNMQLRSH